MQRSALELQPTKPRPRMTAWGRLRLLAISLAAGVLIGYAYNYHAHGPSSESAAGQRIKDAEYATLNADDAVGFQRLGAPGKDDWLSTFHETPQTFSDYVKSTPPQPTAQRRTIVLQPLGNFTAEENAVVEAMREYAAIFFQLPARVETAIPLPSGDGWQRPSKNPAARWPTQYDSAALNDKLLLPRLPGDAMVYMGITMEDLYAANMNFLFGQADLVKRVGVYSLCRYFPAFYNRPATAESGVLALQRACKVINHETGHALGMGHCVFYHCSMNGSNSLGETDRSPIEYCPVCHRKLLWNLGCDGVKRYRELEDFYRRHGLTADADWTAARLERWRKIAPAAGAKL